MMIKTAGGPGMVSPIDYGERKSPGLSRTGWIAIGVVAAAHVGVGVALYNQRFELALQPVTDGPTTIVTMDPPRPEPRPRPTPVPPRAPNTKFNETPTPPINTPTIIAAQSDVAAGDTTTINVSTLVDEPVDDGVVSEPVRPQPPAVITSPSWSRQPSADQMMRAYPERALADGVAGSARLNCLVLPNGSVSDCNVMRETPGGYGFGRAALSLSRHFRVNPRTVNGAAEGSRVEIGLRFNPPED